MQHKHQFSLQELIEMIKHKVNKYNKGLDLYELQQTIKNFNVYNNVYYENIERNQCKIWIR